jgi:fumarate reductase subunit C
MVDINALWIDDRDQYTVYIIKDTRNMTLARIFSSHCLIYALEATTSGTIAYSG